MYTKPSLLRHYVISCVKGILLASGQRIVRYMSMRDIHTTHRILQAI
jgi:hypothetical protein